MTVKTKSSNMKKKNQDQWFFEAIDAYVASRKLKQTQQRKIIARCLLDLKKKHVDVEEVHQILQAQGHAIGIATVYRTIGLFKDAGLLEQKNFGDGKSIYEISFPHEHHDHIICLDCNHVMEFEDEEIENLKKNIAQKMGFKLKNHQLDLFGTCLRKDCPYRQQDP